jgi:anti-sigma factor RsiW
MNELHILTGAYAAGALSPEENEAFVEHLSTCAQCEVEVRELIETTALLGVAAAQPAPPSMRASVMAEIGRTRQLPPVVVSLADRAERTRRPSRRWGLTAAACLAVFSVGLGSYAWRLQDENSNLRHRSDQIAAVGSAPDARVITAAAGGGVATVTFSRTLHQMAYHCHGFSASSPGRAYEIWLIGSSGPQPAGVFRMEHGTHSPLVLAVPGDATKLAITEEPAGGSVKPTTKPILIMPLAGV